MKIDVTPGQKYGIRMPSPPPTAPIISSHREPKRSASLPACHESNAGNAEKVAASKPTVAGAATSCNAAEPSKTRPPPKLLLFLNAKADAELMGHARVLPIKASGLTCG